MSEGTSCDAFIMFNVSFIEKGFYSKFTSRFVKRNRIFWIFCMKSVESVMCDSDFPVRGCSIRARKWDKLYVGEYMALTIGLVCLVYVLLV